MDYEICRRDNAKKYDYKLIQKRSLKTEASYYKFINWVSGEFDLYLQDDSSGLKVYCPNGWFSINNTNESEDTDMCITIAGKSKTFCEKTLGVLDAVYNHINRCFAAESQKALHLAY